MRRLAAIADRVVGIGLGALIVFTPFAFGSVEWWAVVIMVATIFVLGAFWLAGRFAESRAIASTGVEIPIVLFLGLVLFQLVPLPRSVLSVVSPRITALYERTVPGHPVASTEFEEWLLRTDARPPGASSSPDGDAVPMPLTYSAPRTRNLAVLFAAFGLVFLMVADRCRDREKRQRLILWIVCVGCGVGIEGIFQKLAWNGKVLWFRRPPSGTRPFGPFVNPNHFAGYMELIVPLALGLLLTFLSRRAQHEYRREQSGSGLGEEEGWWERLRFTRSEADDRQWIVRHSAPKALLLGFLLALSIASILLSLSRGGILAMLVTFALFSGLLLPALLRRGGRGLAIAGGAAVLSAAVVGLAAWLGSAAITERAETLATVRTEPSFLGRFDTWKRTLDAVREHAVLGSGLGSFETVFVGYAAPGSRAVWGYAHNDYLQLLLEVGAVGTILALLTLGVFVRRRVIPALGDRHRPDWYLSLGLAMAFVSMLLHSFVDFSLQIPAVGFLFVVIAGMLTAERSPVEKPGAERSRSGRGRLAIPIAAGALAAAAIVWTVLGARKIEAERLIDEGTQLLDTERALAVFGQALALAPSNRRIVTAFADLAIDAFDSAYTPPFREIEVTRAFLDQASGGYARLISLDPCSSWGWWGLGQVYARRSSLERREVPSSLETLLPRGEADLGMEARKGLAALRRALYLEPYAFEIYDEMARLYFNEGLRSTALETYTRSARILPDYSKHDYGPAADLPEDVHRAIVAGMESAMYGTDSLEPAFIQKQIGDLSAQRRNLDEAERRYRLGLAAARSGLAEEVLSLSLGEALRSKKKFAEAAPLLERASRSRVVGWWGWLRIGDLRSETGDHRGAAQAYTTAALLSPGDARPALAIARETALGGDQAAAIGQLRYLIGTDPNGLPQRELLVKILREDGRWDEALGEAKALRELAPGKRVYDLLVDQIEAERKSAPPLVDRR